MKQTRFWMLITSMTLSLSFASAAPAQDDEAMQAAMAQIEAALGGELLNNPYTTRWNTRGNRVRGRIVESEGAPGGVAFEVNVRERFSEVWEAQVHIRVDKDIKAGETIQVVIYVRAEDPIRSLDTGNLDMQIARNAEPYDNVFSQNLRPTDEWQVVTASGVAARDFDADETRLNLNIGYGRQRLQFSTVYIIRKPSE